MQIDPWTWETGTRPCRFALRLQGGAVLDVEAILRRYFRDNEEKLWGDALREHGLL